MTAAAQFLAALAAAKPQVRPVTVAGLGEIHIRAATLADTVALARAVGEAEDPYRGARQYALSVCDADGVRLMDPFDDEQMAALQASIDGIDVRVAKGLVDAINSVNEPIAGGGLTAEVDSAGN